MKQLQLMIRSKKFIINVIQDPCKSLKNISYYGLGVSPGKRHYQAYNGMAIYDKVE